MSRPFVSIVIIQYIDYTIYGLWLWALVSSIKQYCMNNIMRIAYIRHRSLYLVSQSWCKTCYVNSCCWVIKYLPCYRQVLTSGPVKCAPVLRSREKTLQSPETDGHASDERQKSLRACSQADTVHLSAETVHLFCAWNSRLCKFCCVQRPATLVTSSVVYQPCPCLEMLKVCWHLMTDAVQMPQK